jgi:TonB family protein
VEPTVSTEQQPDSQGDKLLWILGGGVGAVAVAFIAFMYVGTPESAAPVAPLSIGTPEAVSRETAAESPPTASDFSVRLNRARLAMDANMLIEPEGYSAWSIYTSILDEDATNAAANEGLELVADRLIDGAFAALTAGRRADAAELAERVLQRLPNHSDAAQVRERARQVIVAETTSPEGAPGLPEGPQTRSAQAAPSTAPEPGVAAVAPEPDTVDPIIAIYSDFTLALANGTLRDPSAEDASDHLRAMRATDSEHAMTRDAEQQLFDEFFTRHKEAFNRLDSTAALDWLDAADELQLEPQRIAAARDQIYDFIAAEAATESISAVDLEVRNYVPPEYPQSALRRNLEGWVDVAFVLSRDGKAMNVEAIDESSSIFRNAATTAVEQWEFEPHLVRDRVVEQHAHTRIRFILED